MNQSLHCLNGRRQLTAASICVVACFIASFATAQELPIVVTDTNGTQAEGTLSSIEFETVTVETSNGAKGLEFDNVDSIVFRETEPTESPTVELQLLDGSLLHTKMLAIEGAKLKTKLACGTSVELSRRNVKWIRFKAYEDEPGLRKQWQSILDDESREGDAIVLNRTGELDTVEGIAGDMAEDKLAFSIADQTARVALSKMDALVFYHAVGREFTTPVCKLILIDNSQFLIRELGWANSNLNVTTVCGDRFSVSAGRIATLDFALGRSIILSEMEPTTNDWQPLLTSSAILEQLRRLKLARTNQSFSGQPLSLKFKTKSGLSFLSVTRQYQHGFAIQAGGKLAFSLNGQFKKLSGTVGFDPAASGSGNVLFKVLVDGKIAVETELNHFEMQDPLDLDLDIQDATRIVFQVDYHDGRSTGDQIHMVDMKVSQ